MAAYIYRFLSYVEWPPSSFTNPDSPIVIGVVAADDIASELEQIVQKRTAQNRPVVIRRMSAEPPVGVHALFVGNDAAPRFLQRVSTLKERSVLTITDNERGVDLGSVINFVVVDGRVRFEVGATTAEKSSLKLSSRLLNVALRVKS